MGNNDRAAKYDYGSGTSEIVFCYNVSEMDTDMDGIDIKENGIVLGADTFIQDGAKNNADLSIPTISGGLMTVVDTTLPQISTVQLGGSPSSPGVFVLGDNLEVTLTLSEEVFLSGGTDVSVLVEIATGLRRAQYVTGSGTSSLTLSYEIVEGDWAPSGVRFGEQFLVLEGATVLTDRAGNPLASLMLPSVEAGTTLLVDTGGAPEVTSVHIVPAQTFSGYFTRGATIDVMVKFSEPVILTMGSEHGSPSIDITIGGEVKLATYVTGSGTDILTFQYIVDETDADDDGIEILAEIISMPSGAVIKDAAGNVSDLSIPPVSQVDRTMVDGKNPIVDGVTVSGTQANAGWWALSEVVTITVAFSEPVIAKQPPALVLTVGEATRDAPYVSGSGSSQLVFQYTVQSGDIDTDGFDIHELVLTGVSDLAGNPASYLPSTQAGSTNSVDGTIPTVLSIEDSEPDGGVMGIGTQLSYVVTFSEHVRVSTTDGMIAHLRLLVGDGLRLAKCSASDLDGDTLKCTYQIATNDQDDNGVAIAVDALLLASGSSVTDHAGNHAALTHPMIMEIPTRVIDGRRPIVTDITFEHSQVDILKLRDVLRATVGFDEAIVTVAGAGRTDGSVASLTVRVGDATDGSSLRAMECGAGEDGRSLVCEYEVGGTDLDLTGVDVAANQVVVHAGGSVRDLAGNDAVLSHDAVGPVASAAVDGVAPRVASVAMSEAPAGQDDAFNEGDAIRVTVTFDEDVEVDGVAASGTEAEGVVVDLMLRVGDTGDETSEREAACRAGSTARVLVCEYVVRSGDLDGSGMAVEANRLALRAGVSLRDAAGNDTSLVHGAVGPLADRKVDGVAPRVASVLLGTVPAGQGGTFKLGDVVTATVTFDEEVALAVGTAVTLSVRVGDATDGSSRRDMACGGGPDSRSLVCRYTVQSGDVDATGVEVDANQLRVTAGSIRGPAGNDAVLDHDAVAADSQRKVDGVAPTVALSLGVPPAGQDAFKLGDLITAVLTFSEPVEVAVAAPSLWVQVGTYERAMTCQTYALSATHECAYEVAEGDVDEDGVVVFANRLALNGAGTIRDAAGNNARLEHNSVAASAEAKVDGVLPSIRAAVTNGPGVLEPGSEVLVTVTASEPVVVDGAASVTVVVGGTWELTAVCEAPGDEEVVSFTCTAPVTDGPAGGVAVKQDSFVGTLVDATGNRTSNPRVGASSNALVTVMPSAAHVVSVEVSEPAGDGAVFRLGDAILAMVTFSESIVVSNDAEVWLVVVVGDDGTAASERRAYCATGATDTVLECVYTVAVGDADSTGVEVGADALVVGAGSIRDAAGNDATLAHGGVAADETWAVDGVAPVVMAVQLLGEVPEGQSALRAGDEAVAEVEFSEAVSVSEGAVVRMTLTVGDLLDGPRRRGMACNVRGGSDFLLSCR